MSLECLHTSIKQVTEYSSLSPGYFTFIRSWDAILMTIGYNIYKVFRDGTSIFIGKSVPSSAHLSVSGGLLAHWDTVTQKISQTCQFLAQPIYTSPYSDSMFNASKVNIGDFIDIEFGLVFHRDTGGRYAQVYDLITGEYIKTIVIGPSSGIYTYSYAGHGRLCAISTSGIVVIYDYISWEVVQQSNIGITNKAATYDCNYNLILVVDSLGHINIYGLDDFGDGLSSPTFYPTGNKYLFSGYVLTTRLTGIGGVPISNKWVNWELVGIKGSLEFPFSITDENGYAYNYYWCPTDIALIGSETIKVWCEI
jgi:hypothetical protein